VNNQELAPLFEEILKAFGLKGELTGIDCISTGNINDTYLVGEEYNPIISIGFRDSTTGNFTTEQITRLICCLLVLCMLIPIASVSVSADQNQKEGTNLFANELVIHNVIETEYKENEMGYNYSQYVKWLVDENTGTLTENEYKEFIDDLIAANTNGEYLFTKPYYIYKGIKKHFNS